MNYSTRSFPIIFLQVITLFLGFIPVNIQAADSMDCLKCHKEQVAAEYKKTFIHKPFLQKNCQMCHSPDWVDNAAESDGTALFPHKIKEMGFSDNPGLVHLFSIPKEVGTNILFIEAKNDVHKSFRTKLRIPPFDTLKTLSSDSTPPGIFDVQVTEVQRSNVVTAIIRWKTNKLSSSSIYYGIGDPDNNISNSACYMSEHILEISGLKPDETYNFQVKAEDIYGNVGVSALYSFSTDKSFKMPNKDQKADSEMPMHLSSEILKSEDNYLIRITATHPVSIEIFTYDMPNFPLLREESNKTPADHPPLKSIYETNLLLCETCHQATSNNFSHPVHFHAKLGSNIPDEYPRLPNGQISCITCHFAHASDNQFHLRKSAVRTLCIGCHKRSFKNR